MDAKIDDEGRYVSQVRRNRKRKERKREEKKVNSQKREKEEKEPKKTLRFEEIFRRFLFVTKGLFLDKSNKRKLKRQ